MALTTWLVCALCVQCACAAMVDVHMSSALNTVSDYFISTNLPTSLLIPPKWKPFDFNSPRVRTLLRGLSPSYIRFGGSPSDWSMFSEADPIFVETLNGFPQYTTYSKSDVDNLVDLTRSTNTRILFDLNLQLREGDNWNPINVINLFDYFNAKGYGDNIDFELGNEANWYGNNNLVKLTGTQIGKDYIMLRKLMNNYEVTRRSLLVGPALAGIYAEALQLLTDFINTAGVAIDAASFHNYNFHGPDAKVSMYVDGNYFAELVGVNNATKIAVAKTLTPDIALWNTETADSWGGGTHNVTNKYVSGFLWLDNLGMSAKQNIKVVMRQTFYWGNYSLIGDDMYPNADYWMMYIHKQLVGVQVLDATAESDVLLWPGSPLSDDFSKEIRVYAHCTKPSSSYSPGAVTVFAINMRNATSETLLFKQPLGGQTVDVYMLTPGSTADGLLSRQVRLNGQVLSMVSDTQLPNLVPDKQQASAGVILEPLTFGFMVFPDANAAACK